MEQTQLLDLTQIKDELFLRGARLGFTDMEVYYLSTERFSGKVFRGEIEQYSIAVEGGLAFRGLYQGKMGSAYSERIDASAIDHLLEGARGGAQVIDSDDVSPLFPGSPQYPTAHLFSPELDLVDPARKIQLLMDVESECHRLDPRVSAVQYCMFEGFKNERLIANTRGLNQHETSNGAAVILSVVVKEGDDVQSTFEIKGTRDFAEFDAKELARQIVDEALSYLGAAPVDSGEYPILLKNKAAASLLSAFVRILYASNTQKDLSRLAGKVGHGVAGSNITITDDPLLPEGFDSRSFDHEGVAARRMAVVEGGVLKTLLHNQRTALIEGVEPTGHGSKSSYKGAVTIAPSNLFTQPGDTPFEDLVESISEGLIITGLQGLHSGANPVSGDFSLAASGYYVNGGRIRRAVNQITVAGNFYDLLNQVEAIGDDLKFGFSAEGNIGSPTLKIKSLSVGGK